MDVSKLAALVSILVALSIASERLVEIIKGLIPFLNKERNSKMTEGWRRAALQALAVVAGIFTALLAQPAIKAVIPGLSEHCTGILALGLLASGGSGFWNAVLTYVLNVKDIKEALAIKEQKSIPKP